MQLPLPWTALLDLLSGQSQATERLALDPTANKAKLNSLQDRSLSSPTFLSNTRHFIGSSRVYGYHCRHNPSCRDV